MTTGGTIRTQARVLAAASAFVLALTAHSSAVAVSSAPTANSTSADEVTVTVGLRGMNFVPAGPLAGTDRRPTTTTTAPATGDTVILEISGPANQIDALVDARIAEAGARLAARNKSQSNGSELTPFKFEQLEGTCGWSWVELRSSGSERQGQAYVRAGFQLAGVSSASTYATDVLVYSNAALDLWTGHLKDSGALSGTLKWQKDTRFTVPKTQEYGAHFYVGTVAVVKDGRPASCYTKGPRVDNVKIYVSN